MLAKSRTIQADPLALKLQVLDEEPDNVMDVLRFLGRTLLVQQDMILRLAEAMDDLTERLDEPKDGRGG